MKHTCRPCKALQAGNKLKVWLYAWELTWYNIGKRMHCLWAQKARGMYRVEPSAAVAVLESQSWTVHQYHEGLSASNLFSCSKTIHCLILDNDSDWRQCVQLTMSVQQQCRCATLRMRYMFQEVFQGASIFLTHLLQIVDVNATDEVLQECMWLHGLLSFPLQLVLLC